MSTSRIIISIYRMQVTPQVQGENERKVTTRGIVASFDLLVHFEDHMELSKASTIAI
jgi:hypothetical protein